jgi:DNA polymerase III epsilon subunit-like protein
MKIISIDLETTGSNPEIHQIIEFGAIIEDTNNPLPFEELPKLHFYVKHDNFVVSPYCLELHKNMWPIFNQREDKLNEDKKVVGVDNIFSKLEFFLQQNEIPYGNLNVLGKNFGTFDKVFLERLDSFKEFRYNFHRRILDPAILFTDWKNDLELPNLEACKERSAIFENNTVQHTALEDAWETLQLLRYKTNNYTNGNK